MINEPRQRGAGGRTECISVKSERARREQHSAAPTPSISTSESREHANCAQGLPTIGDPRHSLADADEWCAGVGEHSTQPLDVPDLKSRDFACLLRSKAR